ncbi:MAG: hypothetical protein ACREE0_12750 [Phenylobacterium sp.]
MSERNTPPAPARGGGARQAVEPAEADAGLNKTEGGRAREAQSAEDVEREDSPGGRDGGMIGEG